jgi:nitrate/nitrite transporter NarK
MNPPGGDAKMNKGDALLRKGLRSLPRNVWAVSLTSFFMDVSSEMVLNILPLYLSNVFGVRTSIIGLIEGFAEATASLLKVFSGWLSDRLRARKWLAVAGYGLSAPIFFGAALALVAAVLMLFWKPAAPVAIPQRG